MAVLLGTQSSGTTTDFFGAGGTGGWSFVAAASGNVVDIYCQLGVANPTATAMSLGIYSDSAGAPSTLLGSATVSDLRLARDTGLFKATLASPVAVVSGTTYWLAVSGSTEQMDLHGSGNAGKEATSNMPSTWGALGNMAARPILYATDGATPAANAGNIFTIPVSNTGAPPASAGSAWGFGSWVEILPSFPYDVAILGLEVKHPAAPGLTTTYEGVIEIGTGAAGSESTKLQIPQTLRNVTAVGYLQGDPISVDLPEPYLVAAGTRIAVRVADSHSSALTWTGVKLYVQEQAASGTTISKAGGTASPASTGAARTITHAKANGVVSPSSTGASKTVAFVKSGGMTSGASAGGPQSNTTSRSGGFSSALSVGGAPGIVYSESGGIVSGSSLGADKLVQFVKAGGSSSAGSIGGAQLTLFTFSKNGGTSSAAKLGGTGETIAVTSRAGGTASAGSLGGTQSVFYVFTRDGGFLSSLAAGGSRTHEVVQSFTLVSQATIGGDKGTEQLASRSGGFTAGPSLGGGGAPVSDLTGGNTSSTAIGGARLVTVQKSGGFFLEVHLGGDGFGSADEPHSGSRIGFHITVLVAKTGGITSRASIGEEPPTTLVPVRRKQYGKYRLPPKKKKPVVRRPTISERKRREQIAARRILLEKRLPKSYSEGAKKALANFKEFYGDAKGTEIFLRKATERGTGQSLGEKINSVYKTGASVPDEPKRGSEHIKIVARNPRVFGGKVKVMGRR